MNFFQEYNRSQNVKNAIQVIANCDAAIATLNQAKDTLLGLQAAMVNNPDYSNEDRTAFAAELTRLAAAIEAIV